MSDLYNRIISLCKEKNVSGYRMCKDIGIQPSILTDLKMGRQNGLSAKNADKMAAYFAVSVGYLLGTDTKKAPTPEGEREVTDREIKAAFFRGADMTDKEMDAAWEDVMDLRDIVIRKRKRDAGGK